MISKIIFIRHGLTEGNLKHWYYGGVDIPLSEKGLRQIEWNKSRRIYPEIPEDAQCFTTGLVRTAQTLKAIYGRTDYETIPDLREFRFGDFECRTFGELEQEPVFMEWLNDKSGDMALPGGGDSWNGFEQRIRRGLNTLIDRHWMKQWSHRHSGKDAVTVMICHGGPISKMMDMMFPGIAMTFWDWLPDPGYGYEVEFAGNRPVQYRRLTDLKKLGFGMRNLAESRAGQNEHREMIDYFLMTGHRYFDVDPSYDEGYAERFFRETVAEKTARDEFYLASGLPVSRVQRAEQAGSLLETSLSACGVSSFDYYLLHDLSGDNAERAESLGLYDFLEREKKNGRIGKAGISFFGEPEQLEQILRRRGELIDYVEIPLDYEDWARGGTGRKCYEVTRRLYHPAILTRPFGGGVLADPPDEAKACLTKEEDSGEPQQRSEDMWDVGEDPEERMGIERTPAGWALRFTLGIPRVTCVSSDMTTLEQMNDDVMTDWTYTRMTDAEREKLRNAARAMQKGKKNKEN